MGACPPLPFWADKEASSEVGEGAGTGCEQMGPCLYGAGDRSRPCVQLRILLNPGVGLGIFKVSLQKVSSVGTVQRPPQNHGPPWAWSSDGPLVPRHFTEAGEELICAFLWRGGVEARGCYPVCVPGQVHTKTRIMDAAIGRSIAGFLAD